ncbi:MAG: tetratricopeptide repeat protein [Phycisphaerales bacterium]
MRRRVWLILAAVAIVTTVVLVVTRWPEPALPDPPVLTIHADADPDLARTITSATKAVLEDRASRPPWVKLAMVYQANYMLPEAQQCYEQALSMNGADARSWYFLAIVRSYGGDLDGAVAAIRRSIELNGAHAPAHRRLGEWLLDLDELNEARLEFARATELDTDDPHAWIGLARLALKDNRLDEAAQILTGVTRGSGKQVPLAFQLLGTVYQRIGQPERAQRLVQHSRTITSKDRDAWLNAVNQHRAGQKARLDYVKQLVLQRRFDEAIRLLRSLDQLYPDDAVIPNNLGVVYRVQGRLEDSTREFQRAKQRNDTYFEADYNLALNCVLEGESAKEPTRSALLRSAQEHLDRALAINPSYGPGVGLAGSLLKQHGKLELALSRFHEAARLDPTRPQWLHGAAAILHDLRRNEEALEVLEQVLTSAPYFVQAYVTMAYVYAALGRRDNAEQALRVAVRMQPNHSTLSAAIRELNIDVNVPTPPRRVPPDEPGN